MRVIDLGEADLSHSQQGLSGERFDRVCMRNLLASPHERLFFKDLESRFLAVSEGFVKDVGNGRPRAQIIGKTDFELFSADHATTAYEDEQRIIATGEPIVGKLERETFIDRPDAWVITTKFPLRDDEGQIIGTFGISRDVTLEIEAQQAVAHQALHDSVTGLANRLALMDRLRQGLEALDRHRGKLALLFIDLDDFKVVNDMLGHSAGDQVLQEVARRLRRASRRSDTVARFGGDEFVVLCPALRRDDDVGRVVERLMETFRTPLQGFQLSITCSVGAVSTLDPNADPDELLQQADFAMYGAKRRGRSCYEVYKKEVHGAVGSTRVLASDLRRAIERSELFVRYQPVFRLGDGALSGVEALARWREPGGALISPCEFIPLAERHGLIGAIDAFVLDEACRQFAAWTARDPSWRKRTLAVNLSVMQLRDERLVERVIATLARHQIHPSRLCLEITETALVGEFQLASQILGELTTHGVRIALDDFGTGYSTLAHLQQLRADVLKIDRSFTAHMDHKSRGREIVAAVTAMAHALGMTVIGEGVETESERAQLTELGCDEAQGFLFAQALAPNEIAELTAPGGSAPHGPGRGGRRTARPKPRVSNAA